MRLSAIALLLGAAALSAQTPAPRPAYEAASIKANTSGTNDTSSHGTRGQVVMNNLPLKRLIERAYGVKPYQVAGPDWLENVRFDITAKYPADSKADDRTLMLRTLLEDRFKLAVHRGSKEMRGYALVVAKGGFKLKPSDARDSGTDHQGGRVHNLTATGLSMAGLAEFVSRMMNEVVVDGTGIAGGYDFKLRWANEDQNPDATGAQAPSLPTALQETLGLRLQPQKVPVEIVVVDHVERVPIEN